LGGGQYIPILRNSNAKTVTPIRELLDFVNSAGCRLEVRCFYPQRRCRRNSEQKRLPTASRRHTAGIERFGWNDVIPSSTVAVH
jgi:hypothetical protein